MQINFLEGIKYTKISTQYMAKYKKIGCFFDPSSHMAKDAYFAIKERYNLIKLNNAKSIDCDVVITLGGDGIMLKALHKILHTNIPVFGMNRGSIGFLLNHYSPDNLMERLDNASVIELFPLQMEVMTTSNECYRAVAINEVSLLRQTNQSAKIKIKINDQVRLDELISDGILVSTPAGSTAYNFAANGPIIPLSSNLLALTPISPFRPRKWHGALLLKKSIIEFEILEPEKRPVSAVADSEEIRDISKVKVFERNDIKITLLFDQHEKFEEKVLKEQFTWV